ncbi:MAG: DUF6427 family protein [Bacteroidota bacterium]
MILSLFKKNYTFNLILVLVYFVACAAIMFYFSSIKPIGGMHTEVIISLLTGFIKNAPLIFNFILFLITISAALYLNSIATSNGIVSKNSLVVSGVFFMFTLFLSNYSISPFLVIGVFTITISLHLLLAIPTRHNPFDEAFYSSFLISLLAFVWSPFIFFIFLVWFSFIIYRIFTWREWLISLFGFAGPYLFYGTYLYVIDQTSTIYNIPNDILLHFHFINLDLSTSEIIWVSLIGVVFLFAFLRSLSATNDQNINFRKKMAVLNSYTLISLFIILFSGEYFLPSLLLLGIPFSIYLSKYLLEMKNAFVAAFLFLLINIGFFLKILLG